MSGRGARERRTANRKAIRKPPVISTPRSPVKYVEVLGNPFGFMISCLVLVVLASIVL